MKIFIAVLLCAFTLTTFAQTDAQLLETTKTLVSQKKYLSAYQTLSASKKSSAELTLIAADILINHNAGATQQYDGWYVRDEPDGKPVRLNIPLGDLLWQSYNQWPKDCRLANKISEFYSYVAAIEDQYFELNDLKAMGAAIEQGILPKCPDYLSYYVIGFCNAEQGNLPIAIEQLQKSLALNPNFGRTNLQLGRTYLQKKDFAIALKNSQKAYDLAQKDSDKSKAALVSAQAYEGLNDKANAVAKYLKADSLSPKNFFIQKALLNFYVKTNDSRAAAMLNSFIGAQNRANLDAYVDAYEIYAAYGKLPDLITYCEAGLIRHQTVAEIIACYHFTLGKLYLKSNPTLAKKYLNLAKTAGIKASTYPERRNHQNTSKMITEAFSVL